MNVIRWLKDRLMPEPPSVRRGRAAAREAMSEAQATIKQEQHLTDVRLRVLLDLTDVTRLRDLDG